MLGAPSHLVSGDPQNESSSSFLYQYMTFTREQSEYYLVWQKMWLREEEPTLDYHGGPKRSHMSPYKRRRGSFDSGEEAM